MLNAQKIVLSYGPRFGIIHIYILVLDIRYILGIFTNAYFGDRTGLSLLKLLLEALCSTSSRHRYRKTNTDIQRSIFSLPRFPPSRLFFPANFPHQYPRAKLRTWMTKIPWSFCWDWSASYPRTGHHPPRSPVYWTTGRFDFASKRIFSSSLQTAIEKKSTDN